MHAHYQSLTTEERQALVARRDQEKVRAASRTRYYRDPKARVEHTAKWQRANPERTRENLKLYAERHPEKIKAVQSVNNAIRDGRLVREPCVVCGATPAQGHHPDYSKPLEVVWLCRKHHGEAHRRYGVERAA